MRLAFLSLIIIVVHSSSVRRDLDFDEILDFDDGEPELTTSSTLPFGKTD